MGFVFCLLYLNSHIRTEELAHSTGIAIFRMRGQGLFILVKFKDALWAESDTDAAPFAHISIDFYPYFFGFCCFVAIGFHESTFSFAELCIPLIHKTSIRVTFVYKKKDFIARNILCIFPDENERLKTNCIKAGSNNRGFWVCLRIEDLEQ